jgi:antibiotic biosynthesis monooxygenase (ABM) superfamily enzyme
LAIVLVRLKARDYDEWRRVFEDGVDTRKQYGCTGVHLFRNSEDGNEVIFNMQFDTEENARRFLSSEIRQQNTERAGVVGEPDVWFLDDAGRTPG